MDEAIKVADNKSSEITEINIKVLHGYIIGNNKSNTTEYRTEQNVIKELGSVRIVYLHPEAKDVSLS